MSGARSFASVILLDAEAMFNNIAKAIVGSEAASADWQSALMQDAVATSIIRQQSRDEFLREAAEEYDALIAARDKFNETSPHPICPGCGMRHAPHDHEEKPTTTH